MKSFVPLRYSISSLTPFEIVSQPSHQHHPPNPHRPPFSIRIPILTTQLTLVLGVLGAGGVGVDLAGGMAFYTNGGVVLARHS